MKIFNDAYLRDLDRLRQNIQQRPRSIYNKPSKSDISPANLLKRFAKSIQPFVLPFFAAGIGASCFIYMNDSIKQSWSDTSVDIQHQLNRAKFEAMKYFVWYGAKHEHAQDLFLLRVHLLAQKLSNQNRSGVSGAEKIFQYQKKTRIATPLFHSGVEEYVRKYDRYGNLVEQNSKTRFKLFGVLNFGTSSQTHILKTYRQIKAPASFNIVQDLEDLRYWMSWCEPIRLGHNRETSPHASQLERRTERASRETQRMLAFINVHNKN